MRWEGSGRKKRLSRRRKLNKETNKAIITFKEVREDIASMNQEQDFGQQGTMRKHDRDLGYEDDISQHKNATYVLKLMLGKSKGQ